MSTQPINFAGALVSPVQGKIDIALSQFARTYTNNEMCAEILFPRVPVDNQSDFYWTYGRENQAARENDLRAPGSAAERIQRTLSKTKYSANDHSLADTITDEERGNYKAIGSPEEWSTQVLMDKLMLKEEIAAAAAAANVNNYAAANKITLAGQSQWSDLANSKPITDVETGKAVIRQMGKNPNLMIIGDPVYQQLIVHPAIVERFKYVNGGNITVEQLQQVFGIPRIVVASAIQIDANDVSSFIWGKNAILAFTQPNPTPKDPSFGKTFVWQQAPGTVGGFATEIARDVPASRKSDELAVHFYYDQKVTSNISAYLISAAVQ